MGRPKIRDLPDLSPLARPGAEIEVRATPKAARESVVVRDGVLRVSVTVAPENGKANEAIRMLLAKAMGVAPSMLTLKRGQTSRDKLFVYDER